jgi:hypothetical protein
LEQKRRSPRIRTLLRARLVYQNGDCSVECVVRNISDHGAKIGVTTSLTLPDQMNLLIPQKGMNQRVRVCWRHADEMGVEYVAMAERPTAPAETVPHDGTLLERIRHLEMENDRLLRLVANLTMERSAGLPPLVDHGLPASKPIAPEEMGRPTPSFVQRFRSA